jgi:hypothetical protein
MSPAINQRCLNCGRIQSAHLLDGHCPRGLVVTIDADSVEKARRTGHPRTLWGLLNDEHESVFQGVTIHQLRIVEPPAQEVL